jgi:hypothetical protein
MVAATTVAKGSGAGVLQRGQAAVDGADVVCSGPKQLEELPPCLLVAHHDAHRIGVRVQGRFVLLSLCLGHAGGLAAEAARAGLADQDLGDRGNDLRNVLVFILDRGSRVAGVGFLGGEQGVDGGSFTRS